MLLGEGWEGEKKEGMDPSSWMEKHDPLEELK